MIVDDESLAALVQSLLAESPYPALAPIRAAAPVALDDVRVNGSRVDVRVTAADGRQWLAVLWIDVAESRLRDAQVYERPVAFTGRDRGIVVVVNGPSSAGKSALMAAFADAALTPWSVCDEPWFGRRPTRYLAWPRADARHEAGFLDALAVFARAGNQVLISAAALTQVQLRRALRYVPAVYVGVDASLPTRVARQRAQTDKYGGLAEDSTDRHDGWDYDLRIDTEVHTAGQAAAILAAFLESFVTVAVDDPSAPDVRALLDAHLELARATSPPAHVHAMAAESLAVAPDVTFFSARRNGALVGVGALRALDATHGELKSMHTSAAARGTGVARRMLHELLSESRRRGYRRVSLETGTQAEFAAARALYRSAGFVECEPFGGYTGNPYSVCMALALD